MYAKPSHMRYFAEGNKKRKRDKTKEEIEEQDWEDEIKAT